MRLPFTLAALLAGASVVSSQTVHCVGSWSECAADCSGQTTYTITTPASGGGHECDIADQTSRTCDTGDGCGTNKRCALITDANLGAVGTAYCLDDAKFGCADVVFDSGPWGRFSGTWFLTLEGNTPWTIEFGVTRAYPEDYVTVPNNAPSFVESSLWATWDAAAINKRVGEPDYKSSNLQLSFTRDGLNLHGNFAGYCTVGDDYCINVTLVEDGSSNGQRGVGTAWKNSLKGDGVILRRCVDESYYAGWTGTGGRCMDAGRIWRDKDDNAGSTYDGYSCDTYDVNSNWCEYYAWSTSAEREGYFGNTACCTCGGGNLALDCVGQWEQCTTGCVQSWTTFVEPFNGGVPCASGEQYCFVGDGLCTELPQCNTQPQSGQGINNTDCENLERGETCEQTCLPGYSKLSVDPKSGAYGCAKMELTDASGDAEPVELVCGANQCYVMGSGFDTTSCNALVTDGLCNVGCRDGWTASGSGTFTCPEGVTTNDGNLTCAPSSCGQLNVSNSASPGPYSSVIGDLEFLPSFSVTCLAGHTANGLYTYQAVCQGYPDGTANWTRADCEPVTCPEGTIPRDNETANVITGCVCGEGFFGVVKPVYSDQGYSMFCEELGDSPMPQYFDLTFESWTELGNWTTNTTAMLMDRIMRGTGLWAADIALEGEIAELVVVNQFNASLFDTFTTLTLRVTVPSLNAGNALVQEFANNYWQMGTLALYEYPLRIQAITAGEVTDLEVKLNAASTGSAWPALVVTLASLVYVVLA